MTEVQLAEDLRQIDVWYWAYHEKIKLPSGVFLLDNHEYQVDILQCDHPRQVDMKGAQMGITESVVLKTLHGHIYNRYPQGTLYLFPTQDDVTDFSKARFTPLISGNPCISAHVTSTDAANIKRVGNGMLYFRSARSTQKIEGLKETSSRLKSVPVDRIVVDELDEMDPAMIDLALERVSHSTVQEWHKLSTPSIPDYGIDKEYQASDQRIWMIKCQKCNTETCLEKEFPACIQDGKRVCRKCGQEIYPKDGQWIAQYPTRSKDVIGRWISQLNSAYVSPQTILDLFYDPPHGNITEVYNSKLGMAYIAAENRLTVNDVYQCCGLEPMARNHKGPCAMGVDVGKMLHIVIGHKKTDKTFEIDWLGRVSDFNDVHDLAMRFKVACAVIDAEPETRKVREFQAQEPYRIFLCDYQERLKTGKKEDEKAGLVAVRRTEVCDTSHELVITPGKLTIPRRCAEVEEYAKEMANLVKTLEEDKNTGSRVYHYRKLGDDHYRHATNYFYLACQDPSVRPVVDRVDYDRHDTAITEYDLYGRAEA